MSAIAEPSLQQAPDHARILILDYGSQYTQLIARRVREVGVYSEIHPHDAGPTLIARFAPSGIILSGGPESVLGDGTPRIDDAVLDADVPILGICYGMQALAAKLGGRVAAADHREYGHAEVRLVGRDPLLGGLGGGADELNVWMSHGDRVERLPQGFAPIASTASAPLAAMADVGRRIYGLQFHPEVTAQVLQRWCREAAEMLDAPGAHGAARQIAEAERYDKPMARWLEGFLDLWLEGQVAEA